MALVGLAFLALSGALTRVLAAAGAERAAVVEAVSAGRPEVRILRIDGPPRLAVRARTGTARVAWRSADRLPVVQCVAVRRGGDLLSGFSVAVVEVGEPQPADAGCPERLGGGTSPG
jgi:hypothetical protein